MPCRGRGSPSFLDTVTEFDPASVPLDPDATGEVSDPEWLASILAEQKET